ncbi:hypothetical protein, partial [Mesorhizobium sp. M5C.F.Ca.IN.020.29.1.1]|uniref:hypothetical protein n=1 Tax=Mesorhizobium sp. M5C.F.Ca.IN.020.29.1.1 TaxID=2496770 RepID=UPI0019D1847A
IYIGAAYGQDCRRLHHAWEETFAVAGQRLGCPAEPGNRRRDSKDASTILRVKRDASWSENTKQKKNKSGYCLFFKRLSPLARREQKRYKLIRITDCPAFIDDQGVMYHGSEFFAACRGQSSG